MTRANRPRDFGKLYLVAALATSAGALALIWAVLQDDAQAYWVAFLLLGVGIAANGAVIVRRLRERRERAR